MIPVLVLVGLVLGRWWWLPLMISAVGWPVLLVANGAIHLELGLVAASALAVLNAGVGVLVHWMAVLAFRRVYRAMRSSSRR